jgi:ketosteroid isomerase-like protein
VNREQMIGQVEALYAARRHGDFSAIDTILAPDSEFKFAGLETMVRTFPGGMAASIEGVARALFDELEMRSLERLAAVVEGNKVAAMWDASARARSFSTPRCWSSR